MKLPNLIGIGAGRTGTTYLYTLLESSKDVFLTPVKEANYFGIQQQGFRRNGKPIEEYAALFDGAGHQRYRCEITPVYITNPVFLRAMRVALEGTVQIIATLRDPVERFRSQFIYHREKHGYTSLDKFAEDAIESFDPFYSSTHWYAPETILRSSFYAGGLRAAIEIFGPKNVLALILEEQTNDPRAWPSQLSTFLHTDIAPIEMRANASKPSAENFSDPVRAKLTELFRPEIDRLTKLISKERLRAWPSAIHI